MFFYMYLLIILYELLLFSGWVPVISSVYPVCSAKEEVVHSISYVTSTLSLRTWASCRLHFGYCY